jgi:hypothetical protein
MMPQFDAGRAFQPGLNVRDFEYLVHLLEGRDSLPNGVLWPLVAARRAGKTWALKALEDHLGRPRAQYLDLSTNAAKFKATVSVSCLLLDEPGPMLQQDAGKLLTICTKLKDRRVKVLIAMSPREWEQLRDADHSGGRHINRDDLCYLKPLRQAEVEALTVKRAAWTGDLVPKLLQPWRRHAFLLELVLEIAERDEKLRNDVPELLRTATDEADGHRYVDRSFYEGFSDAQRDVVRQAARQRAIGSNMETAEVLCRCHILEKQGQQYVLADPILADHLPPPLRIHHVSDLHVGPKTAPAVDVKAKGTHGDVLGTGAGAKPVRDAYLDHVNALPAHKKPHLVVVSGDIAEMGDSNLYEEAQKWFTRLETMLAAHSHPGFPDSNDGKPLPRILVVPGNHDVNWNEVFGPAGSRKRHIPFAQAFADYPRPRLEEPPQSRPVAHVSYGKDLGVEFLLLGSAEFGGQQQEDIIWERLVNLLNELRQEAIHERPVDEMVERLNHLSRIDPGLVHDDDLVRAAKHRWELPVRIAVLHHPVSPLPATEVAHFTGLINAGRVKNLLMENQFCLVLHGHMHFGWFAVEQWPGKHGGWALAIAAAPTLGSRETQHQLGYNVVEVAREGYSDFVVTVTRVAHDTGGAWEEKETMGPIQLRKEGTAVRVICPWITVPPSR